MNIKIITLLSCLFFTQAIVQAIPLTIINITEDTINFNITLERSAHMQHIIPVASHNQWIYSINNDDKLITIQWRDYSDEKQQWNDYLLDIKNQIPTFNKNGGTILISREGSFLYDGKRGLVKGGLALITQK